MGIMVYMMPAMHALGLHLAGAEHAGLAAAASRWPTRSPISSSSCAASSCATCRSTSSPSASGRWRRSPWLRSRRRRGCSGEGWNDGVRQYASELTATPPSRSSRALATQHRFDAGLPRFARNDGAPVFRDPTLPRNRPYFRFIASASAAPNAPIVGALARSFGRGLSENFPLEPRGGGGLGLTRSLGRAPAFSALRIVSAMRLRVDVDLDDAHLHHVARLHHLVRVLDEAVGELRDDAPARPDARRCRRRRRTRRRWSPCLRAACPASGP